MDLCWHSNVSAFQYAVWVAHSYSATEQASFNFVTAVTVCSDFEAQGNKVCTVAIFPSSLSCSDGTGCHDLDFLNVEFKASFSHSPLSPTSRGCLVPFLLSVIRVESSAYLRLLIFLPPI